LVSGENCAGGQPNPPPRWIRVVLAATPQGSGLKFIILLGLIMSVKIEMTGKQFGNLIVIAPVRKDGRGEYYWRCRCTCGSGKTRVVRGKSLRGGDCRGCGCLNPIRLRPFEALYRKLVRDAKTARSREVAVDLSYEEFLEFTKTTHCFYCDAGIEWKTFMSSGHGYRLDRKDSGKGYSTDNCVVCCTRCNRGKSNLFTFDEWVAMTSVLR